jgi:iron complex outermembrane recepter protein
MSKYISSLLAGVALLPCAAFAQQASTPLPPIDVVGDRPTSPAEPKSPSSAFVVTGEALAVQRPATSDAASLISSAPGVSLYQAGGVSSLPVIHGLNDDRNNIVLGGVPITSACANHMNPPMSYIDPNAVANIEVLTANIPVSKGGDSVGGTIIVTPRAPVFAAPPVATKGPAWAEGPFGPGVIASGSISAAFRSNGGGFSLSGHANVATDHFSLVYDGAWAKSGDYHAGGGALVRSTEYETQNQAATLSYRNEDQIIAFHYAYQNIPYQGFVNQYMDMLGNNANTYDLSYKGGFGWGLFEANAYYHITQHYMNFLPDRVGYVTTPTTGMPMYSTGQDYGYAIKAEINLGATDLLRVGNELHLQRLNDWWSPVGNNSMGMMCCSTFQNINNGQRDVLGTYVEWERRWSQQWSTLIGLRNDTVWMNTGDVQGYNMMMYGKQAAAFNAQDHARTDVNFDATATARFSPDAFSQYDFGYTLKMRSPNLYERYTWSTNTMAAKMNGWFGDGNGYVGNINLKAEAANTIAATVRWTDPSGQKAWDVKLTPYYSYVQDYIDVDKVGTSGSGANAINILQFANHDAELYGFDLSGRALIAQTAIYGDFSISGVAGYVRGWRVDNGMSLYHMMPLNGKVALENAIMLFGGRVTSAVEVQAAAVKSNVETTRLEPTTPAYGVVNMRASYEIQNLRFDLGVENLADKLYYNPLGGIDIADYRAGANTLLHTAVAAQGRTVYGGMTVKF